MIELSRHVFELLRTDEDSILYRGRDHEDSSQVLVLAPAKEEAGPESLKRLEHEYSLKEDLDPAWAARPAGSRGQPFTYDISGTKLHLRPRKSLSQL